MKTKVTVFRTSVSRGIADGWASYHLYGYTFPRLALFLLPHHPLPPVPRPYWAPCWPHPCWAPSVSGHLHLLFPHLEHSSPRYHQGWFPHLSLCAHISFSERSSFWPCFFKSPSLGTLLEVQWLRLHIPNAGGSGSIPSRETRSCILQLKLCMSQLKILWAATKTQCGQKKKIKSK